MKLVSVAQMRAIEKEADSNGLTYSQMMQNAGRGLAEIIHAFGQENGWEEIVGLVGPGNNGGDTLVALTWLAEAGWKTKACLVKRLASNDELVSRFMGVGGDVNELTNVVGLSDFQSVVTSADVILDGLLGTGIRLPLKPDIADVLQDAGLIISKMNPPPIVFAVDCPSGVDCDTGEAAAETIPADMTITMAAVKQGLLRLPAYEFVGELQIVDIGLPEDLKSLKDITSEVADADMIPGLLPERNLDSHKGTFGTALIAAGSINYTGAALLAGKAAYRIGAGLVTMAIPEALHAALAGHLPEATWVPLAHQSGFISEKAVEKFLDSLVRATAVLIGPGIGGQDWTRKFIEKIISSVRIPLVVDADGLRHLASIPNWHEKLHSPAILTPHPGEMSALTGLSTNEIQAHRLGLAVKYAEEWGHVVVLKGAFTVIASSDGRTMTIPVATPALARAGSGDVLAGMIVGLCAQGLDAYAAAIAGAYIHAQAGLLAAEVHGGTASVLAGDLLDFIGEVLSDLS